MKISTKHHKKYNRKQTRKVKVVEILTQEQLNSINSIKNQRDRAVCIFLLNTGLRVSELTELDYGTVFEDIRSKIIVDKLLVLGKGNKERTIILTQAAKQAILDINYYNRKELGAKGINKNSPLLLSRIGQRLTPRSIQLVIKRELNTSPHIFRHTCFTNMSRAGVIGVVIQKAAGHSEFSTTAKYYLAVTDKDIAEAFETVEVKDRKGFELVVGDSI